MFLNPKNKRNLIIKHVGVTYNWRLTGKGLKKDEFKFVGNPLMVKLRCSKKWVKR